MQYTMDSHNNSTPPPQDDNDPTDAHRDAHSHSMLGGESKAADTPSHLSNQYMQELAMASRMKAGSSAGSSPTKKRLLPLHQDRDSNSPKRSRVQGDVEGGSLLQAPRASLEVRLPMSPHPTTGSASAGRPNVAFQQQFFPQPGQGGHPLTPLGQGGTLPRPPTSPGTWNVGIMGHQQPLIPEDFTGANAALRRNLASLQEHQQHPHSHHQHPQSQQQQQQQNPFPQQFPNNPFAGAQPLTQGSSGFAGASSSTNQYHGSSNMAHDPLGAGAPNQLWASEMLLRTGAANSSNHAPNEDNRLVQLQLLRQQQARIQHLEQLEEQAVMRRQLQLLRQQQQGNPNHPANNMNPMNMNSMMNMNMNMGGVMQDPDSLSLRESILLQQQLQQQQQQQQQQQSQQQGMFLQQSSQQHPHQQQQQQQQWGMQSASHQASARAQQHFAGSLDAGRSGGRNDSTSRAGSSRLSTGGVTSFRRSSTSGVSSMARATPMVGPVAPPVPAPPPISEANYKLPPVEEGECRHYEQRVHVPLAIEEDHNWLSEFQCFVRRELLQVFRASHQDVKIRVASKKVYYKQVGIRCKFCAHWKPSTRAIRSSAFPSSIRQLYQSFTMMLRDHFGNCPAIPAPLKDRFLELKRNNTQGASDSMRYWIYSAVKLGMVDSDCGIILNEHTQAAACNKPPFGTAAAGPDTTVDHPPRLLVKPEDLQQNTIPSEFLYTLLTQYQLIRLLPTECIGNRKSLRPGVPGLGCRYCCQAGRMGLCRVFPAKKKQLPTQIEDLYSHIRRCNLCPLSVKQDLSQMKTDRDKEKTARSETDSAAAATATGKDNPDDKDKDRPMRIIEDEDKPFVDLLWQRLGHRGELATPIM